MSEPTDEEKRARRDAWNRAFAAAVPHNRALGIEIVDLGPGFCVFRMPYDERFVGNPDTGVLHGGVITALLDACLAAPRCSPRSGGRVPIATLDLRIDYLQARRGRPRRLLARDLLQAPRATSRSRARSRTTTTRTIRSPPRSGTFMLSTKIGGGAAAKP